MPCSITEAQKCWSLPTKMRVLPTHRLPGFQAAPATPAVTPQGSQRQFPFLPGMLVVHVAVNSSE